MTRVFYPILRYVSSSLLLFLFLMSFHIAECNIRECWRENSGFRIWSTSSLPTSSPFLSTVAEDETLAVLRHVTRVHLVIGECSGLWRQLQGNHAANTYMSQMLYAGQSARPSVPFLSDFKLLYRAQFMCLSLIHI